ncbi:MAG: type III pantothenate kinase [Candidimonas sp.]|jgi:type III pantothenate kinase
MSTSGNLAFFGPSATRREWSPALLIDAGNSRVKLTAVLSQDGRRESTVLALAHGELDTMIPKLRDLGWPCRRALGVNVAGPAVRQELDERVRALTGSAVAWMRSQARQGGVRNGYDDPGQLGADRWAALIGLSGRLQASATPAPALLASFGTATTIDMLGPDLFFHGGLILPGPDMMLASLADNTADLPKAHGTPTDFPRHTHQAIVTGVAAAQAGAVLRQWRIGLGAFGAPPRVYVTGGAWTEVEDEVRSRLSLMQADLGLPAQDALFLPHPVLDGLAALAARDHSL